MINKIDSLCKLKSEELSLRLLEEMKKDKDTWKFLEENQLIPQCKMIMKISYQIGYKDCCEIVKKLL